MDSNLSPIKREAIVHWVAQLAAQLHAANGDSECHGQRLRDHLRTQLRSMAVLLWSDNGIERNG